MIALWVALGAALGAPARHLTDRALTARFATAFPWGTFTANVIASLALGAVAGLAGHLPAAAAAVIGTGFCGALSTYSAFGFQTMRLTQTGRQRVVAAYVGASLGAGIGVGALGWWAASVLV